jgi:tryptophan-rich sensory protein
LKVPGTGSIRYATALIINAKYKRFFLILLRPAAAAINGISITYPQQILYYFWRLSQIAAPD